MTSGNESKGQATVRKNTTEHRLRDMLFSKMSSDKREALQLSDDNNYEMSIAAKNMLQQFILQKQALLIPMEILMSNLRSFNKMIIDFDIAQREAESHLDYNILSILKDFDRHAHQLQKEAICRISRIVEKRYFENCHNCTKVVKSVLSASLCEEAAKVIPPLYLNMSEYLENKFNYTQACFWERIKKLVENMHQQVAELFGLYWEGEITMPAGTSIHLDCNVGSEPIFSQSSPLPPTDPLPDSILNPLILQEIKTRIHVEIEKQYQVLHLYYQECLEKAAWELKDNMRTIVIEAKNQIQSQLDNAAKQREDSHDNLAVTLNELEHTIYELNHITFTRIPNRQK